MKTRNVLIAALTVLSVSGTTLVACSSSKGVPSGAQSGNASIPVDSTTASMGEQPSDTQTAQTDATGQTLVTPSVVETTVAPETVAPTTAPASPVTTKAPSATTAPKPGTTTVAQLPLSGSPQEMTQQVISPLATVANYTQDFKTWTTKLSQMQASVKSYGMTIVWDPAKKGMDVYQISVGGSSSCYLWTWADPSGNPAGGYKFFPTSCSY
jgi:hypothetical protein